MTRTQQNDNQFQLEERNCFYLRPNPHYFLQHRPIDDIGQVQEAKSLEVMLNYTFIFDSNIQYIRWQCSQRMYLVRLLHKQLLSLKQSSIVSNPEYKVQYAISVWGGFIRILTKNRKLMPF
jgi:hypothetical protein